MNRLVPAALALVTAAALAAGCNHSKKAHAPRASSAAAAGVGSQTGAGAPPASWTTGSATTGAGTTTTPPSTGVGSRHWYVGDAFGNPFKAHTASEAALTAQVLALLNQQRAAVGAGPLLADAQAERAAKVHVEDMAGRAYFAHSSPEGWTPDDRLRMTGASGYTLVGENIAVGQRSAQAVMDAWTNSPGHRANMLDPRFTHVGIGVDESTLHWAQVFLRR